MAQQRRVVIFSGDVQGVGFRATALRAADGFEVTGYVRNLAGGRVEVLVEGEAQQIDAFLEAVREHMGMYISDEAKQPTRPLASFTVSTSGFEEPVSRSAHSALRSV